MVSVAWYGLNLKPIWFSEIEPFPCAVLAHHYPAVPNHGDMTTLPERILSGEIEAPDILVGGTPCQAFSVAGLRNSLNDERGNLTLVFVRILNAINTIRRKLGKPDAILLWENVPGVLSTRDNAFGCFLAALLGESKELVPKSDVGGTVKRTGGALSGGSETLIVNIGATLSTGFGGRGVDSDQICNGNCVINSQKVRKLTHVECERLQGFPDNYTRIPWRNKPAEQCPDTPRYMAIGNSMAVPVMRWIGERICGT